MGKTASERLNVRKEPKKVVLESNFAGLKQGQVLFVGTPKLVADYVRKIPYGETRTVDRMRREMARRRGCDGTCPMSTAIFLRIAAESACEDMEAGTPASEVLPFWRIIAGTDKIVKKLPVDSAWIETRRRAETG